MIVIVKFLKIVVKLVTSNNAISNSYRVADIVTVGVTTIVLVADIMFKTIIFTSGLRFYNHSLFMHKKT